MRYCIVAMLLILFIVPSFAQDESSPAMNWCNVGGPMEGKCTIPDDEALTNYFWEIGWYLAAVDRYEIALSDIPDRYIKKVVITEEATDKDKKGEGSSANCDAINLPGFGNTTVTVTGELIYEGVTYISQPVPAGTYETFAEGEEYDPSIIGDKHKVKITGTKANGKSKKKSYTFNCEGPFDPTAGGIIPAPTVP